MRKLAVSSTALAAALVVVLILTFFSLHPIIRDSKANIRDAFNSTCVISTGGTGVLLENGYVLTAGHVVDKNDDKKLSLNERRVTISFRDGTRVRANVLYLGIKDFAILEPVRDVDKRGISPSSRPSELGEKIYTIGATAMHKPHITSGHISTPDIGMGRASCYISGGNSGGAIFSEDNEYLGTVCAVGVMPYVDSASFLMRIGEDTYNIFVQIPRRQELNSLCLFLPVEQTRDELDSRFLGFLLDKPEPPTLREKYDTPFNRAILWTAIQIQLILALVMYVRKDLFG